jgi:hypothetical protein
MPSLAPPAMAKLPILPALQKKWSAAGLVFKAVVSSRNLATMFLMYSIMFTITFSFLEKLNIIPS